MREIFCCGSWLQGTQHGENPPRSDRAGCHIQHNLFSLVCPLWFQWPHWCALSASQGHNHPSSHLNRLMIMVQGGSFTYGQSIRENKEGVCLVSRTAVLKASHPLKV